MIIQEKKTILLVEDEMLLGLSAKSFLERQGYLVTMVDSGEAAIATVKGSNTIDLVLMDIDLGDGVDGTEVAALILNEQEIPVVFLSSHTEPEVVEKTEKITSYGYVVKNSSTTVLDASIKMAFKLFNARQKLKEELTERKLVEDKLRASENSLSTTLELLEYTGELAKVGGWQVDLRNMKLSWTLETFRISEITPPIEPPLEEGINLFAPEARPIISSAVQAAIDDGTPYDLELPLITAKGRHRWVRTQGYRVTEEGKAIKLIGTFQDITDRKRVDEELRLSQDFLNKIINTVASPIFVKNENHEFSLVNDALCSLMGLSREELIGSTGQKYFPKEQFDVFIAKDKEVFKTGQESINEEFFTDGNGIVRTIITHKSILSDIFRNKFLVGIINDISERKEFEDKVKGILLEKDLMLKEVHHRIKNNMATVYSLLSLQEGASKEPLIIHGLKDAQNRVQSMMVLYDKLYKSVNFKEMSIQEYLPDLVVQIVKNFPNSAIVKIEHKMDDFMLDSKKISYIGIIVNELLTNIMKYAFTGKDSGLIVVSASLLERQVSICIQDDGNGIPESFSIENSNGFGLVLIRTLTLQLKGQIRFENQNGTKIILEFQK